MSILDNLPSPDDLDKMDMAPARRSEPSGMAQEAITRVAQARGLNPEHLMGLAKLETRMGAASIKGGGQDSYNLFNIKDFSKGGTGLRAHDKAEGSNDRYRQYASYDESADDLAGLLERRYPGAVGAESPQAFAQALKDGGYATDPNYVSKLTRTIGGGGAPAPSKSKPSGDFMDGILSADDPIMRGYVAPAAAKPTKRTFASDVYETGRQVGAGFAVDLPRMVGQGMRWTDVPELEKAGRSMVESADERASGWEPDLQNRGIVADTLIKGARAIGPMAPAIAAGLVPGGQAVGAGLLSAQFLASQAQDTEDKLRQQGVSDSEATAAGWRTGLIQGPLEGASMLVGGMAFKPMAKALGLGLKTTTGVAGQMTDTAILRPLAKGLGLNLLAQPATEVAQDVGTEFVERSYGAKPENAWAMAKDSAQGAIGLTLLLGPFAGAAHVQRSKQAAALKEALYSPNADPMVTAQARDMVATAAKKQGVAPGDIGSWLDERFAEDDALVAQAVQAQTDDTQSKAQSLFDAAPAARAAQNEQDRLDITNQSRVDFANQQTIPEPPQSMTGTSASSLLGPRGNPLQQGMAERGAEGQGTQAVQQASHQQAPAAPTAPVATPEQQAAQQKTEQLRQRVEQEKATVAAQKARAESLGLKGTKAAGMLSELDALKENGDITEAEHADSVVELGAGRFKAVENWLTEKFTPTADVSKTDAKMDTSAPPVQKAAENVQVASTAKETPSNVPAPANPGKETSPAPGPKAAPVAAQPPAASPAKVRSVTTEVTAGGKTARVVRVAPVAPIAPVADKPDFRERNRAANTRIAALRAERKKLVAVKGDEADVGSFGDLDRSSPEGQRVAQIDNEINAALPPVADIRAHVEALLTDTGKTRNRELQARLSAVTGITAGKDGLEQAEAPTPMAEVARRDGVTKQAISKQLQNAGLSDLHIGRLVANDMAQGDGDAVQAFDASQDEDAERTSGFEEVTDKSIDDESSRISSSAAKAMGDGIVEVGGRDMTPEEKAAEREATLMLKRAAAKEAEGVTAQDLAFAEKRRKLAEEETIRRLAVWATSSGGANAVSDWDHYRSDAIPAFADLTPVQQLEWLKAVSTLEESEQSDPQFIRNLQQSQERGIEPNLPAAGVSGAQTNVGAGQAGVGQDSEIGGGSGATQTGPKPAIVIKKKRIAVLPGATPQRQGSVTSGKMSLEEVKRLVDRVSRSILGGQSIEVMDVPLGTLPGATEIGKGETAPDGRITIYAATAESEIDVIRTVFHEMFHRGVKGFFKSNRDYIKSMLDLSASNEAVRQEAEDWKASEGGTAQRKNFEAAGPLIGDNKANYEALAVEEALAQLGERLRADKELGSRELRPFVRTAAQWLSRLADRAGLRTLAQAIRRMTYNELENFVSDTIDRSGGQVEVGTTARLDGGTDATVYRAGDQARQAAERVMGTSGRMLADDAAHGVKKLVNSLAFLHDLVDEHAAKLPAVKDWYKAVQATIRTRTQLESDAEQVAVAADKLKGGTGAVNAFLSRSTFEQKWGYDPAIPGKPVKIDGELAKAFHALTAEEKAVVRSVFAHAEKMQTAKATLFKKLDISGIFKGSDGRLDGPYAPLKRFGDYVVVLKSQQMIDAEKQNDTKLVEKLKADLAHYQVPYFDTMGQAKQFARENQSKYALADAFAKSERIGELEPMNAKLLQKVLSAVGVDKNMDPKARDAMSKLVNDMYLQSIDEHNARTSGVKRLNRAGFDADMIRSFLSHARAEAGFLSNMEHGGETNAAFFQMQQQAKDPATGARIHQDAFNTFASHYAANLDYKETPWQDRLMAGTSAFQLATSVGYHVANAMQPAMVTVPKLAADFNDYAGAWKHMIEGYRTVGQTGMWGQVDLTKVKNTGLRAALQEAVDQNILEVGNDEDLTRFNATRTGVKVVDGASQVARTALHMLRKVSRAVETANRVASATAGYNMALSHGKTVEQAQDYAVNILRTTQGDTSRTGAPLLLKKLPKVMTQYKKFQFTMAALYVKAFRDATQGATPEVKAIGRRMLAYKLGHTVMAAGVLGMPLMNLVAMVFAGLGGGDDEPADLERTLRESGIPEFMLRGPLAYAGLDMSAKLGEDKVFSIMPYTDWDLTSKKGLASTVMGLMGPSAAQAGNMADGIGALKKGDYDKGIEKLMPKGVASGMKAFRIANEGYTLKNGDVMYKPDDVNGFALALDALGLPSSALRRMDWMRGQQYEIGQFFKQRTTQIEQDYSHAVKAGDTEAQQALRQQWMALQAGKDHQRKYFGDSHAALKRQPLSELMMHPHAVAVRERKLQRTAPVE